MDEKEATNEESIQPDGQHEVSFKYLKSNLFRVVHADGAWGGLNLRGDIHVSFYNERVAIPDSSKLVVAANEEVIKPEEFESSSKFIREVEVDVVFDLATAKSLRAWLNHKIDALENLIRDAQREKANNEEMASARD